MHKNAVHANRTHHRLLFQLFTQSAIKIALMSKCKWVYANSGIENDYPHQRRLSSFPPASRKYLMALVALHNSHSLWVLLWCTSLCDCNVLTKSRSWTKFFVRFSYFFLSIDFFHRPLAHDKQLNNKFSVTRRELLFTRRASLAAAFAKHHHKLFSHLNLISKVFSHLFNYYASQPVTRYQPSDVSNWSENIFAAIGCLFASKYNFHGNPKLYFFYWRVFSGSSRAVLSLQPRSLSHFYLTLTQKNLCYSAKKEKHGSGFGPVRLIRGQSGRRLSAWWFKGEACFLSRVESCFCIGNVELEVIFVTKLLDQPSVTQNVSLSEICVPNVPSCV